MATAPTQPTHPQTAPSTPADPQLTPVPDHQPSQAKSVKQKAEQTREELLAEFAEDRVRDGNIKINWANAIWLVIVHGGALAAPFVFSWPGLALTFFLWWLTGGIGICLGYHRLFTHRSFQTVRPMRWAIAFIGGLAGEGSAIHWVATHRKHHAHSDKPGDPHSPVEGAWWSHMLWLFPGMKSHEAYVTYNRRWAPDLVNDPVLRFLDVTFILWHILMGVGLFTAGYLWEGPRMGASLLVYGLFLRLVFVLHATWFVNSASHMWGYRNYETTDDSRNNWWVAALTWGEGWHNNHHAFPTMARHGHKPWEIDITFLTIKAMEKVGLAWNVVDGYHEKERTAA